MSHYLLAVPLNNEAQQRCMVLAEMCAALWCDADVVAYHHLLLVLGATREAQMTPSDEYRLTWRLGSVPITPGVLTLDQLETVETAEGRMLAATASMPFGAAFTLADRLRDAVSTADLCPLNLRPHLPLARTDRQSAPCRIPPVQVHFDMVSLHREDIASHAVVARYGWRPASCLAEVRPGAQRSSLSVSRH